MREILSNRLWIGNVGDSRSAGCLLQAGVAAVINLAAEELSPTLPRSMIYCHFPIMDGVQDEPGILDVAIQTLVLLLKNEVPTLVYCSAGMSRSPALAAAALAILQGGSPDERLKQMVAGQPHDVSPQLWEAVTKAYHRGRLHMGVASRGAAKANSQGRKPLG
jgi:protein-tyrosine phosphatase